MKLTMLGTGMAMVTKCYNTCFALQQEGETFLIDGGGGNTILKQLEDAQIDWRSIHHIFIEYNNQLKEKSFNKKRREKRL